MTGAMDGTHLVVVGSGIAGLYGALQAVEAGIRVTLLTKAELGEGNTRYAQGGICAVLAPDAAAPLDTVESHLADTLKAGAGQCDPAAARVLCAEAAADIAALERLGIAFDVDASGRRALGLEGAHSAARILHAGGDATGAVISAGLVAAVRRAAEQGLATVLQNCFATELLQPSPQAVAGVAYLDAGEVRRELAADAVLLATGGAGQLFAATTNPAVATGDGVALAWRAGAVLADLEYFQFHPTALACGEHFLISEAVRGAGAVLRNAQGMRFMPRHHPEAELAPRDVVARSIAAELADADSGPEGAGGVFLDATGLEQDHGPGYLASRFPTIAAAVARAGLDWTRQWLPITPAAHYWMGGVLTDLWARTTVPGLYAAGEVACTGVHGANRLASNSLLEGLVFSRRAVAALVRDRQRSFMENAGREPAGQLVGQWPGPVHGARTFSPATGDPVGLPRARLQQLMGHSAGVARDGQGLRRTLAEIAAHTGPPPAPGAGPATRRQGEERNLLLVAQLLLNAALARGESLGAHQRRDFPQAPQTTGRAAALWRQGHPAPLPAQHLTTTFPLRESESV